MSQFARPADWLRQLFIPSRTGWRPPGRVSEEVSLTQPYDGGGFAIWPVGQWVTASVTAVAAAAATTGVIAASTNEQVTRILAAKVQATAGVLPSVNLHIFRQGTSTNPIPISELLVISILTEHVPLTLNSPIIPPGHEVRLRWFGGDAATIVECSLLICTAPLGSVFYV